MGSTRETDTHGNARINAAGLVLAVGLFFGGVALVNWAQARGYAPSMNEPAFKSAAVEPAPRERLKSGEKQPARRLTLLPPLKADEGTQPAPREYAGQVPEYAYASAPARRAARPSKSTNTKTASPATGKNEIPVTFAPAAHPDLKMGSTAAPSGPGMLPDLSAGIGGAPARTPAPPAASGQPAYALTLKPTSSKYLADTVSDTLHSHGFENARTVDSGDGTYSVHVGEFNFRYAAENARQQLNTLGFSEAEVSEPGQ